MKISTWRANFNSFSQILMELWIKDTLIEMDGKMSIDKESEGRLVESSWNGCSIDKGKCRW